MGTGGRLRGAGVSNSDAASLSSSAEISLVLRPSGNGSVETALAGGGGGGHMCIKCGAGLCDGCSGRLLASAMDVF